jgi:hypothetical protein
MEAEVEREVYPRASKLEAVKLIHFALVRARCVSTGAVQRCQPVNLRVNRVNPIFMVAARAARDYLQRVNRGNVLSLSDLLGCVVAHIGAAKQTP